MKKLDKTVKKETLYIAYVTLILSVLMQAVFLILQKWDISVLLGNLWGDIAAVGNFLLLGITIQKAVSKPADEVQKLIKLSLSLRMVFLIAFALTGYLVPIFHTIAVIVPYLFPRIAIALRTLIIKE